ncbi:hypothetical protein [Vibrio sp. PID23_8]|uniref:hypothetical protein n=1 Tax=Vibrio sp. PID23_8 TaxID=1583767 RepID=UPI0011C3E20F|nr:hypothetical protein [Vibrio sp. PID23_8]
MSRNRKNKGWFAGIPIWLVESQSFVDLSTLAKSLLIELAGQYNGRNNGYLSLTRDDLKRRGYNSPNSNQRAIQQLLDANIITRTFEGGICRGKGVCSLYAINWQRVDERTDKPLQHLPIDAYQLIQLAKQSGTEKLLERTKSNII